MKEDTRVEGPWTYGEEPQQGKRVDLEAVKRDLDDGARDEELAEKHFSAWLRYRQAFKEYRLLKQSKRSWPTTVSVYWGASGTGKTRRAEWEARSRAEHEDDIYWLNNTGGNTLWWDGYTGQSVVVIDDFYGWVKYSDMLRVIDRYPYAVQVTSPAPFMWRDNVSGGALNPTIAVLACRPNAAGHTSAVAPSLQVRGAAVNFLAKHVIITSNDPPHMWWQKGLRAMARRLDPPNGLVTEMLIGVWAPPVAPTASSVPLPLFSDALSEAMRETTPMLIDSGSSTRPAISSIPSGGGLFTTGTVVNTREAGSALTCHASATSCAMASTTTVIMPEQLPTLSAQSPAWQTSTRMWRTPSPAPPLSSTMAMQWGWQRDLMSECDHEDHEWAWANQ